MIVASYKLTFILSCKDASITPTGLSWVRNELISCLLYEPANGGGDRDAFMYTLYQVTLILCYLIFVDRGWYAMLFWSFLKEDKKF